MALSIYSISIPVVISHLKNMESVLRKGEAHALAKKIEPSILLNCRLFPDMFALIRQVQIASDMSKGAGGRLAGVDIPKYEDNEASFSDLYARLQKTVAFLEGLPRDKFEGAETRNIVLKLGSREATFTGEDYVSKWVFPNLLFHVTTAYNILRHNGVELGKKDFLGEA